MNKNLERLYKIGMKEERMIIGLMSGTSFDGLDVALCRIKGYGIGTQLKVLEFETKDFDPEFKEELKSVFAKKNVSLEKVCMLNPWIAKYHAVLINACLEKWNYSRNDIDLVASHGQTIYHAPRWLHGFENFPNSTLQIGDGDHLAVETGIITISDFRQKHIAQGGEGAPLAVYGDFFVFADKKEDRIMLNIGGIANFTWLPAGNCFSEVFCTDVGPGNTIMDALMQRTYPGKYFDEGAKVASAGKVNEKLLSELQSHPFFKNEFPKTTGPELFNLNFLDKAMEKTGTKNISIADQMATLNRFSANMIVGAIKQVIGEKKSYSIYVSGGGMHNPLLMENLEKQLPGAKFISTSELNVNPDAKEAVLFALLANECVSGGELGAMGKISFPT